METKIIKAVFGASKSIITQPRYRYDYGQVIEVSGIDLPESFEARLSNAPTGESVRVLGSNQRIAVPDDLFYTGKSIWCYITIHDEATDGRTMYTINVPVNEATERTEVDPSPVQQDIIAQTISALNVAQNEWKNMTAEAVTLESGEQATASYSNGVLTLGIPKGESGDSGGGGGGTVLSPATKTTLGGIIVGDDLQITPSGVLSVSKANSVEQDNTRPITSAAVYTELGNINALLATI